MLGVGAIIGTGIFVLTGQAAGKHAGPAVIISMVIAGIVSAFAALCYSEFAASVPISGSAYAYGYGTLGEFVAWIIGWDLILEYAFGAATVAVGWSGYVVSLFRDTLGINFPLSLSKGPLGPDNTRRRHRHARHFEPARRADRGRGYDAAHPRHQRIGEL